MEGPLGGRQICGRCAQRPEHPDRRVRIEQPHERIFSSRGLPRLSPGTPLLHPGQRQRCRSYQLRGVLQGGLVVQELPPDQPQREVRGVQAQPGRRRSAPVWGDPALGDPQSLSFVSQMHMRILHSLLKRNTQRLKKGLSRREIRPTRGYGQGRSRQRMEREHPDSATRTHPQEPATASQVPPLESSMMSLSIQGQFLRLSCILRSVLGKVRWSRINRTIYLPH